MKVNNLPITLPPLNSSFVTAPYPLYQQIGYSVAIFFTGTPTGSFSLEVSSDPCDVTAQPPTHWTVLADSTIAVSAAGDILYNVNEVMYNWVRIRYTDGSAGASSAVVSSCIINSKGF